MEKKAERQQNEKQKAKWHKMEKIKRDKMKT